MKTDKLVRHVTTTHRAKTNRELPFVVDFQFHINKIT